MMLQFQKKGYIGWGLFLILLIFLLTRVIYLDRDLPPYDKTLFGSKDEQGYNYTAINLYHFSELLKEGERVCNTNRSLHTILNNSITYISLRVFGNNYYGLRGSAVFASLIIFMLFVKLISPILLKLEKLIAGFLVLYLTLMLLFDFGFLVATRNAAPVIFRSMYTMLIISYLAYASQQNEKIKYLHIFLIGTLSSFLIFFSYLTNAFIFAGLILFFILKWLQEHDFRNMKFILIAASTGFIIGAVISNVVYEYFFNLSIYDNLTGTLGDYGGRLTPSLVSDESFSVGSVLKSGIFKTLTLFSSNLFILNYIFLSLIISSIILTVVLIANKCKLINIHIITFSFVLAYISQAFFYNPHSSKWIIVIFPVLLLFIASTLVSAITHKATLLKLYAKRKIILQLTAGCILLINVLLFPFKIIFSEDSIDLEFLFLFSFSLLLFLSFYYKIGKYIRYLDFRLRPLLRVLILMSFIPNIYLSMKYCFLGPQHYYRDALITLNEIVNNKVVAGSWSDGFRLYTNGNTIFPWYQNYGRIEQYRNGISEIFEQGLAEYTLDYTEREYINIFNDIDTLNKGFKLKKDTTLYLGKGSYRDSLIVVKRIPKYSD